MAVVLTFSVGNGAYGVAIDGAQNVWVTNDGDNTVSKLFNNGTVAGTFITQSYPQGVAIDSGNNVWVVGGLGSVSKLNNAGGMLGTFPVGNSPQFVAIDSAQHVWVTNWEDNTVTKLFNNGTLIGTYPTGISPMGLAIDNKKDVWIANNGGNVTKLSNTGAFLGTYFAGSSPYGVAIDAQQNVWVTNSGINTVTKYFNNGTTAGTYATGGTPQGIGIDSFQNVWITNYKDGTLTKLSNTGTNLGIYAVGSFPQILAIDANNAIWVTYGNNDVAMVPVGVTANPTQSPITPAPTNPTSAPTPLPTTSPTTGTPTTFPTTSRPTTPSPTKSPTTSSPTAIPTPLHNFLAAGLPIIFIACSCAFGVYVIKRRRKLEIRQMLAQVDALAITIKPEEGGGAEAIMSFSAQQSEENVYAFITHSESEKSMKLAMMLQSFIERKSRQKVLLDSGKVDIDVSQAMLCVGKAKRMIVLLTKDILLRTSCLIELNHAFSLKIPIIAVIVEGEGFDPQEAVEYLTYLDTKLDAKSIRLIKKHGMDVVDMAFRLANIIPNCPTKTFNFNADEATRVAQLSAISEAIVTAHLKKHFLKSKDNWLAKRTMRLPSGKIKVATGETFLAFVSHHKVASAAGLAVTIKKALEASSASGGQVFVDQEAGHLDLSQLLVHLEESRVVILLQTKDVLTRPYCLLELNHAVERKIPIVAVRVEGEGYDFEDSREFLTHLDTKLDSSALKLIKDCGVDVLDICYHLSNTIPNIVAKSYNFRDAERIRDAQLEEIEEGVLKAQFNEIPRSKEEWLANRSPPLKSPKSTKKFEMDTEVIVEAVNERGPSASIPTAMVIFDQAGSDSHQVAVSFDPDLALGLWRKRVEQLDRFYKHNDPKLATKTDAQLRKYVLEIFEDFAFDQIIKTIQSHYPGCEIPKKWLDDFENKRDLGTMPDSILLILMKE